MKHIQKILTEKKLDALLITKRENIFYLTGFRGSFGMVIMTKTRCYLITDFRYLVRAKKEVDTKKVSIVDLQDVEKTLSKYKTVGFESDFVTVARFASMKKVYKNIKWIALNNAIGSMRIVKSDSEIKIMKKAQSIAENVLADIKTKLKVGKNEKEIEWEIQTLMRQYGAEGPSFDPIVAFGSNSAIPHHEVTTKKLKMSDTILLDFGVKYKGYCSDMTRVFFLQTPTSKQAKIYNTVLEAQKAALAVIKAGVKAADVDAAARKVIDEAGYSDKFGHALGHGVGVEIHESPSLSTKSDVVLQEGMVVTVEPGIYLEGFGGVRIEDTVVVTKTGYKNFMKVGKEIEGAVV